MIDNKKFITTVLVFFASMALLFADNVHVNDVEMEAGETKSVEILLDNTTADYVSFQMDLYLPEGISVNKSGCSLTGRFADEDMELVVGRQSDGAIRLTATSFNLVPITGTSGAIINLSLKSSASFSGGTATVDKIIFVNGNSVSTTMGSTSFNISVPVVLQDQTLNLTSIPTMTYGDGAYTLPSSTDQSLALTWTSSNTGVATVSGNTLTIKGAGSANITASQAGNDDYNPFEQTFTLTVNKAQLTITADDKTKTAGEANPELTVSYSGFVYDDTEASLNIPPAVTTTADESSPAGEYPITVSGAESENYEISCVPGILTVVAGCTPGDVNGDGEINGFDIVYMVDIIMGDTSVTYDMSATDLDGDGEINGFDLVELVDLILSQPVSGAKARRAPEMQNSDWNSPMLMSRKSDGGISVGVESADDYILSQFVLELSDGQQLTDITASDRRHVVAYRAIDDNRYAVLCYSTRNAVFTDSRDMLTVSCEGCGTVRISDVMLVDADKKPHYVRDAEFSEATGIELVNGIFSKPSDIYSISGTLVRKNAKSINGLGKGIYIHNGKTIIIK